MPGRCWERTAPPHTPNQPPTNSSLELQGEPKSKGRKRRGSPPTSRSAGLCRLQSTEGSYTDPSGPRDGGDSEREHRGRAPQMKRSERPRLDRFYSAKRCSLGSRGAGWPVRKPTALLATRTPQTQNDFPQWGSRSGLRLTLLPGTNAARAEPWLRRGG